MPDMWYGAGGHHSSKEDKNDGKVVGEFRVVHNRCIELNSHIHKIINVCS
jgi:hypothetical protein